MHDTNTKRARCQQRRVHHHAQTSDAYRFFNLLTDAPLFSTLEALLPDHRERLFPPTETLSMFLAQSLNADGSCQNAVNQAAMNRMMVGMSPCSTATGAYCKARQRLPSSLVSALVRYSGQHLSGAAPARWHWQGRPVRLIDGTTVTLPDTEANQSSYPQPGSQQPGLGFPICRLVGVICLSSGGLLNAAMGRYIGKGADEQTLLRGLLDTFESGDMVVADSYYCTYFLMAELLERGVDVLFEQYGSRKRSTDFRTGRRLGERDHLIRIDKPGNKPDWMNQADYERMPDSLSVREFYAGGKVLVTSLVSTQTASKQALKELYKSRWNVELDLRAIKTTLGMETLSCKDPQMNEKQMWVYLLAYNLIRLIMAEAALLADVLPRQLSFKHALQLWLHWRQFSAHGGVDNVQPLLILIGQRTVANRPGRIEPRAVKRRPKAYPLLTKRRAAMQEHIRKYGHPRKIK